MEIKNKKIFDERGNELYGGRGSISKRAMMALVNGKAYTSDGERIVAEPSWKKDLNEILSSLDGLMVSSPIKVNLPLNNGGNMEFEIKIEDFGRSKGLDESEALDIAHGVLEECNPTIGGFERSIRGVLDGINRRRRGGDINLIPSPHRGECKEEVWIIASAMPINHNLAPRVHGFEEGPDELQQNEGWIEPRGNCSEWNVPHSQMANGFVEDNLARAAASHCLQNTWERIHIWMPTSQSSVTNSMRDSLERFRDAVEFASRRSGRKIEMTIHWTDGQDLEVFQ